MGRGEIWTREKVRWATVHKAGSKLTRDWLYLQSINSDKHLSRSPFTGQFFMWRHFALLSIYLISPCANETQHSLTVLYRGINYIYNIFLGHVIAWETFLSHFVFTKKQTATYAERSLLYSTSVWSDYVYFYFTLCSEFSCQKREILRIRGLTAVSNCTAQ